MIKLLFLFLLIPASINDCPKITIKEQGKFLAQYLSDNNQWKQFNASLETYGYCWSQFGLKENKDFTGTTEQDDLINIVDDAVLRCENLMNQFEPGSKEYNKYSVSYKKLREVLNGLNN